ncbi:hypothetical protein AVEN_148602-1 [Araneus ventricosus]|uniref:Uncharacterized protein n=1 Tax=Araneus ventricosus TaxID=182803 RepID=A0A4Y2PHZ3_ARAVE|nr:hypothetical protein AVEN_148602-1 [Araneus ventricosus]
MGEKAVGRVVIKGTLRGEMKGLPLTSPTTRREKKRGKGEDESIPQINKFSRVDKKLNICTKCNMIEATLQHLLDCVALVYDDLLKRPDFRVGGDEGERPHGSDLIQIRRIRKKKKRRLLASKP